MGCPSPVKGDVALLVFVCSVTGVVAPSYVVDGIKGNRLDLDDDQGLPTPLYIVQWVGL